MQWILLILAGVFEVTWAIAMKYSNAFTVIVPTIITVVGYIASAIFLSMALKHLPLGTAYAMWTGFGIIGTTILGIFLFGEKLSAPIFPLGGGLQSAHDKQSERKRTSRCEITHEGIRAVRVGGCGGQLRRHTYIHRNL